jgi:uncharacterized protein
MTIEVTPVGVVCNLSCPYCYEHPLRDGGNFGNNKPYDVDKMIAAIESYNQRFNFFGGEALLTDIKDLEIMWKWGHEKFGMSGMQTNAVLMTDEHIELMGKYNVFPGISCDGPDDLNDSRWAGTLEKTRESTKKTMANIEKLSKLGRPPGLIITMWRGNVAKKNRTRFKEWLKWLDDLGVRSIRLHLQQMDYKSVEETVGVSTEDAVEFALDIWEFQSTQLKNIVFDMFDDVSKNLAGLDGTTSCIFNVCDIFTTDSVQGIDGQGNKTNCGRISKEGVDWIKTDDHGWERYVMLYNTPQEHRGCKDCRFFLACKSNCPGTVIDADFRNRTVECLHWKVLFSLYEKVMVENGQTPISLHPRRKEIEELTVEMWKRGINIYMKDALSIIENDVPVNEYLGFIEVIKNSNPQNNPNHLDHSDSNGDIKRKLTAFPNAMEYWKKYKGLSFGERPSHLKK